MPRTGSIVVVLKRGDRRAWGRAGVEVHLIDPFASVDKDVVPRTTLRSALPVRIQGIPMERGQPYALLAFNRGYRPAARFPIRPKADNGETIALMLVRREPEPDFSALSFRRLQERTPHFHRALERGDISESAFLSLTTKAKDMIRAAAALNIEAKLRDVTLSGTPAIEFLDRVESIDDLLPNRILCRVLSEMVEQAQTECNENKTFVALPEWANEVFHAGYEISYKQNVPFGSLQLSFAKRPEPDGTTKADIDIDLFTDIGHWGEVFRNRIATQRTDPYAVYVQLFDQGIEPLYVLQP